MVLFLISLAAGALTVLAPCILPLLPVIVGGSITGDGKGVQIKKVLTIVLSLGASVIVFTLLLKASTLFINIPEYVWKWISGGIIIVLGFITLFPKLWEGQFLAKLSAWSNILLGKGNQKKSFWGDVIVGAALGPVFSTCSPTYFVVLATVLPAMPLVGMVYLFAYAAGLCISLFVIAFVGQKIMAGLGIAADPHGWVKKILGVLFLIVGISIIFGFDKKLEFSLLSAGIFDVTRVEQKLLQFNESPTDGPVNVITNAEPAVRNEIPENSGEVQDMSTESGDVMTASGVSHSKTDALKEKAKKYKLAPELSSIDGYINTDGKPITLKELRGKVVLLDIWTYSCINCQRTLPYLKTWYDKYKDQDLVIVGLHTPEFAFEKLQKNVEGAVQKFGIKYPVVLDNDFSTWNAYGNQYWPRKYLIDEDGYIVYDHIGEGAYDVTEKEIQKALKARNDAMGMSAEVSTTVSTPDTPNAVGGLVRSPEIYFGSARNTALANGKKQTAGSQTLTIPKTTEENKLYLGGTWNLKSEYAESAGESSVLFKYDSKDVYFVGGSVDGVDLDIYKDGAFVKTVTVKAEQLYTLIDGEDYGKHTLEIKIKKGTLQAFTFTFG